MKANWRMEFRSLMSSLLLLILFILLISHQSESLRPKWCHKKRYKKTISPQGIPDCKKTITVVKCEGFCESFSKPSYSAHGVYFKKECKCCQPFGTRAKIVKFPCGSVLEILQIKKCDCLKCWLEQYGLAVMLLLWQHLVHCTDCVTAFLIGTFDDKLPNSHAVRFC